MSEQPLMYDDYLRKVAQRFENRIADIEAQWGFDYGIEFEITLCRLLRQVLPQRYGICRGFVVTRDGQKKGDDLIIFDRDSFPTLRLVEQDGFERKESIPVESVYAYLEAKHTLCIEGRGRQSLYRACQQVADVKSLPREGIPWTYQDPYVAHPQLTAEPPKYWPPVRNQMYGGVVARRVQRKVNGPLLADSKAICDILTYPLPQNSLQPDLIIANRDVVFLPTIDHGFHSPFFIEGKSHLSSRPLSGLAFGAGICSLLHALDMMRLGAMPWPLMIADAIGLRVVTEGERGTVEFAFTFPLFTIYNSERQGIELLQRDNKVFFPLFTAADKALESIAKAGLASSTLQAIDSDRNLRALLSGVAMNGIDEVAFDPELGQQPLYSIHIAHFLEALNRLP